jgi:hypothetical protein
VGVTAIMREIRSTFLEDLAMVEAQERTIAAFPSASFVDVGSDEPTIQARRLMDTLTAAERQR